MATKKTILKLSRSRAKARGQKAARRATVASTKGQIGTVKKTNSPAGIARNREIRTQTESRTGRPHPGTWNLRLYVAGDSPKSRAALENLERLCALHLRSNYRIEVVDLRKKPGLAKIDQILALPTLVRRVPGPVKRVIGDLSNAERALIALDIHPSPGA